MIIVARGFCPLVPHPRHPCHPRLEIFYEIRTTRRNSLSESQAQTGGYFLDYADLRYWSCCGRGGSDHLARHYCWLRRRPAEKAPGSATSHLAAAERP